MVSRMAKTDKNIDGKVIARIVRLREMKGLTQRELANRADMQHGYVARIEQGEVNPTLQTLGRIARGIGVVFFTDGYSSAGAICFGSLQVVAIAGVMVRRSVREDTRVTTEPYSGVAN